MNATLPKLERADALVRRNPDSWSVSGRHDGRDVHSGSVPLLLEKL